MIGRSGPFNGWQLVRTLRCALYMSFALASILGVVVVGRLVFISSDQSLQTSVARLISDPIAITAALRTVVLSSTILFLQLAAALLIARLASPLSTAFRALLLLPVLVSPVSASIAWSLLLSPVLGPVDTLFTAMHLPTPAWFSEPLAMFVVLAAVDSWQWLPFMVVVLLVRFERLPASYVEQATLEGASAAKTFFGVLLPSIRGTLLALGVFRLLELVRLYDAPAILFGSGGPGGSMDTLSMVLYRLTFQPGDAAYAAFLSLSYMLLVGLGLWYASRSRLSRQLVP